NSFEVTFYDKLKDVEKARFTEKRGMEWHYGAQLDTFRREVLPKELEVLRMEVRLGTRAKIKSVLKQIGVNAEPTFESLFDGRIARAVLWYFWSHIRFSNRPFRVKRFEGTSKNSSRQVVANLTR